MINVWLALRGATHALIQARLLHGQGQDDPPPYNGPVADRHADLFRSFADWEVVQPMFKQKGTGNAGYTLYSVNIPSNPSAVILDLQDTYPGNQVLVLGGWFFETGDIVPGFPIDPQALDFMPDVWNGDDPPTYSPATELADVNLLMGQAPRKFV